MNATNGQLLPDVNGELRRAHACISRSLTCSVENASAYFPQLSEITASPVRRVDQPAPAAVPPSLRSQLTGPAVRIALGLAIGVALVFLLHYLDPTVRERAELESLGYAVIGEIPRRPRFRLRR